MVVLNYMCTLTMQLKATSAILRIIDRYNVVIIVFIDELLDSFLTFHHNI